MNRLGVLTLATVVLAAACALPGTGSIALDDVARVEAGGTTDIAVLLNDRAPPGERLSIVDFEDAVGSVRVVGDRIIEYRAPRAFTGTDTFTYTVTSDSGSTATASVAVVVEPPPAPPPEPRPPELLVIPGPEGDFGEIFVTQSAEITLELEAVDGSFEIGPFDDGDVSFFPDPACTPLEAGERCSASVVWFPGEAYELDQTVFIAGEAPLRLFGRAVPPLSFDPPEQQLPFPAAAPVLNFLITLVNMADTPVPVDRLESEGALTDADFEVEDCVIVDENQLPAGGRCVLAVSVDLSDAAPGEVLEGRVVAFYAETAAETSVTVGVPSLAAPAWIRPVPGQGFWWEYVMRGFAVEWEGSPLADWYELTAAICWDGETTCDSLPTFGSETSTSRSVFVVDPAAFEATHQAVRDAGLVPVLALTATAHGFEADGAPVASPSSELRLPLTLDPFEIWNVQYDPPPGSDLFCRKDRITASVELISFLLDPAELSVKLWDGGYEVFISDEVYPVVVPSAEATVADVSVVPIEFAYIDEIGFYLDGIWGGSDGIDYRVECTTVD